MKNKVFLFISIFSMIFFSCEDEDPTTQSTNYITACNEARFEIQFYGTNFWDNDLGQWYNYNNGGNKLINHLNGTTEFCRKYIDDSTIDPNDPFGSIDTEETNDSEVDVNINSDGTQDVTLKFTDMNELAGLGNSSFFLEIELKDIDSFNTGQAYTISDGLNVSIGGDYWDATFTVTFTNIDVSNHIYEGQASALIENYWPLNLFPNHYEPGTSLNFTCEIDYFSFDKL